MLAEIGIAGLINFFLFLSIYLSIYIKIFIYLY